MSVLCCNSESLLLFVLLSALLMQKEISRTFEQLKSQVESESCVLMVCDSPVFIWPNRGCYATPEEITPETLCKDIHQWIE